MPLDAPVTTALLAGVLGKAVMSHAQAVTPLTHGQW
jgi:hypothetical protein